MSHGFLKFFSSIFIFSLCLPCVKVSKNFVENLIFDRTKTTKKMETVLEAVQALNGLFSCMAKKEKKNMILSFFFLTIQYNLQNKKIDK